MKEMKKVQQRKSGIWYVILIIKTDRKDWSRKEAKKEISLKNSMRHEEKRKKNRIVWNRTK